MEHPYYVSRDGIAHGCLGLSSAILFSIIYGGTVVRATDGAMLTATEGEMKWAMPEREGEA